MSASALKERLRADLRAAIRKRSSDVGVLRTLIAAIDNAEAIPIDGFEQRLKQREHVGEVARRELDQSALEGVLASETHTRLAAAQDYERNGRTEDAARLRKEVELIARYRA